MAPKLLCFKYYVNYIMLTNFAKSTGLLQAGVLVFYRKYSSGMFSCCRSPSGTLK